MKKLVVKLLDNGLDRYHPVVKDGELVSLRLYFKTPVVYSEAEQRMKRPDWRAIEQTLAADSAYKVIADHLREHFEGLIEKKNNLEVKFLPVGETSREPGHIYFDPSLVAIEAQNTEGVKVLQELKSALVKNRIKSITTWEAMVKYALKDVSLKARAKSRGV